MHEPLWKAIVLGKAHENNTAVAGGHRRRRNGGCVFAPTWRETYVNNWGQRRKTNEHTKRLLAEDGFAFGVCSDVLHHYHVACHTLLQQSGAPEGEEADAAGGGAEDSWMRGRENVRRIAEGERLSTEEFLRRFEETNTPVILRADSMPPWATRELFRRRCGACAGGAAPSFNVGGYQLTLDEYFSYMDALAVRDDQPLYLFDREFFDKVEGLEREVCVPSAFRGRDLFEVLDGGGAAGAGGFRPHYRWLIIGGRRSGSQFHVDPNGTCAWNMVIYGSKRWMLFRPGSPPPGVFPDEANTHTTSTSSIGEWYASFFGDASVDGEGGDDALPRRMECTVRAGEVVRPRTESTDSPRARHTPRAHAFASVCGCVCLTEFR